MYDIAKKARAGMKAKAERLAGEKDRKTDSSNWTPAPELNADVKTGMRPVSRRAYKKGGKVEGSCGPMRADRKPRKAGGKVNAKGEQPLVDRYINRDLKKANEYRDGKKHIGALKSGGRAKKAAGGSMTMEEMIKKNPAPAKKPLGLDKIPLPPRRPADMTTAAPGKIDPSKYITGDDITGPPKKVRKDGGRAKKQDGGGMDPRLGIVSPKALNFAQNLVTPGLKKGGRAKKEVGGPAIEAGKAAMSAMTPAPSVGPNPSASNIPPVGSGLLPQPKGNYEKPPAYDPEKYNTKSANKFGKKGFGDFLNLLPGDVADKAKSALSSRGIGISKGGRIAKADGGSMRQRFNAEFAKQRAAGAKKFTFEGKEYTTELAKPNKAPVGAMPGSSRAGAPPMGAGPGSRSANVAPPQDAGPGSANPRSYTPTRVMGGGQGATNRATPSVTTGTPPRDERYYEGAEHTNYGASLGNKRGGRIKKQIGGALGRAMPSMAAGAAMRPQVPQVGQGMMGRGMPAQFGQGMMGRGPAPQAMANAQGRPFQPGGKFATQPAPMPAPGTPGGPPITTMPIAPYTGTYQPGTPTITNFPNAMQPQPIASDPFGASMGVPMNRASMPRTGNIGSPMGVIAGPSSIGGQVGPNVDDNFYSGPVMPDSYAPAPMPNPMARKNGGRVARAFGGETTKKSKGKSQGKSNINIIISTGKAEKPEQPPMPPMGAGAPPLPPPAPMMGAGAPPPMGGPGMPPMGPPPGPMMPPMGPPMPRKAGGRVSKVARSFKDMTAGAGSGEGRLQKTDIAKRAPHKAGGKVYRSYKDMDAGAGSGEGRLEKTQIQKRKK